MRTTKKSINENPKKNNFNFFLPVEIEKIMNDNITKAKNKIVNFKNNSKESYNDSNENSNNESENNHDEKSEKESESDNDVESEKESKSDEESESDNARKRFPDRRRRPDCSSRERWTHQTRPGRHPQTFRRRSE